jgi:hypothetical protein
MKFYKSFLNSNNNRATNQEFFGCLGISIDNIRWFVYFKFLAPCTLRGCNFLISNPFSTIVSVSDAPRGGVQVLFEHQKQQSPPP